MLSETSSVSTVPRGQKLTECSEEAYWRKRTLAESLLSFADKVSVQPAKIIPFFSEMS